MPRALAVIIAAVAVSSLAACSNSSADRVNFNGNKGGARTATCKDGTAVMIDNDNIQLTLSGPCDKVTINANNVTVSAESVRSIAFNGDSNKVSYSSGKPSVTGDGKGNRAVRAGG
jgi:hypothetical protein